MTPPSTAALYFHTLRHLKPVQIWGRVRHRLRRPRPDLRAAPPVRNPDGRWVAPAARLPSLLGPTRFSFLAEERELASPGDWNAPAVAKLWLYNLHYFDDLNATSAADRTAWHRDLIARWIAENPPGQGIGWDPYPSSLRIVNWIKWALAGKSLDDGARYSLAVQVRFLAQRLERHLLGNHLLANAKALIFAGCYFDGEEAAEWLRSGADILRHEIPEQILADGGHFERSSMYHALAYEDVLDLANLTTTYALAFAPWQASVHAWPPLLGRMGHWLAALCHPDGEIAFFNDSAIGIAPSPADLFAYAGRLGLPNPAVANAPVAWLKESGYVCVRQGDAVALIDVAPVGPDYLPGHAHADTLSFELSLGSSRVLVNSGTSVYGEGPERERQRGTAAHNTVVIDGRDSSEVWRGFRVARRAYPRAVDVRCGEQGVTVEGCHDGYRRLPGATIHSRRWTVTTDSVVIDDALAGTYGRAEARLHLHPEVAVAALEEGGGSARLHLPGYEVTIGVEGGTLRAEPASWHPSFGLSLPNTCLAVALDAPRLKTTIRWRKRP